MWEILSATPACSAAATLSPPPMMVMQPLGVSAARVLAMAVVPASRGALNGSGIRGQAMAEVAGLSASFKWA